MIRRNLIILVMLITGFNASLTQAQVITGKVINAIDGSPIQAAEVALGDRVEYTDYLGKFIFADLKDGSYDLRVTADGLAPYTQSLTMAGQPLDLLIKPIAAASTTTSVGSDLVKTSTIGVIEIEDLSNDAEQGQAEYSSLLTAGRDQFDNAAAYNLSNGRFRPRGLLNEYNDTYVNGMYMNDLDDGRVNWGFWGGLNDVFRVRNARSGLQILDYAYGGINGTTNVDLRASSQWKQIKAVYTLGNRSYANRVMLTYGTGMMDNGWAISLSGSRRWGEQGFIDGTYYDAWSYFMSIDRKLSDRQMLNLVVLGAPTTRGRSTASVQEAYDLAGTNFYNPLWGYQEGKVRNSREYRTHQPIAMLRHDIEIGKKTNVTTTIGAQFGTFGSTRLEWFNASDPRPDYYRKLPTWADSPEVAAQIKNTLEQNPDQLQIQWDKLYQANYSRLANPITINNVNGVEGNSVTGGLAAYTIDEQHFDTKKYSLNSVLQTSLSNRVELQGGLYYLLERTENYVELEDLLGAEFAVDWDDFAARDFPGNDEVLQNDLNRPNRIVYEGDRYGYDYDMQTNKGGLWTQVNFTLPLFDFYVGGQLSNTSFYREGNVRDGNFPNNSFGKSETVSFTNYGAKAGATYKINGRNYLYANGQVLTKAPFSRFAFMSPRTRNQLVPNLKSEQILAGEIGYTFKYSGFKGRLTSYYNKFKNQVENASLYFDVENTFGNFIQSNIEKSHVGTELGFELAINQTWSVTGAAGVGAYYYDNRPDAILTIDNNAQEIALPTIYTKNFRVPGLPQEAFTAGVNFSKNYWFANLNANYFRKIYLDFYPLRRTELAVYGIDKENQSQLWDDIIQQQEMDPQFTLDFFGGKSWKRRDYYLAINLSVGNILDNREFVTGGFEQFRFDFGDAPGQQNPSRFQPRLFYGYGRNFSINVSVRH